MIRGLWGIGQIRGGERDNVNEVITKTYMKGGQRKRSVKCIYYKGLG